MAFVSHYRKVEETPDQISYAYGWEPDILSKTLRLDKVSRHLVPSDEAVTHAMTATAAAILRVLDRTGQWPQQGHVAS